MVGNANTDLTAAATKGSSQSLSKTICFLESRMLDEATVPLCLPRKSGQTQAILQSSENAGGDTAAKEKRRSKSLNISTKASFSI